VKIKNAKIVQIRV